jgi:hypothetical protein
VAEILTLFKSAGGSDVVHLVPSRMTLADVYMSVPALKTPKTLAEMRKIVQNERAQAASDAAQALRGH